MAIIYSYPNKATLVDADEVLIIDSESINPAKQTKHTSLSSLLTYIDNNLDYDLQQVLTSGATAYAPVGTGWNGVMSLGYNDGVSNIDKLIIDSSSGATSLLTINGNTLQQGDHQLKFNSSDFILGGGALTATAGNNTNISSAQNMSVIVSPMRDFRVQTDADINHQSRDFVGNYMRSISLGATSDVRLYSGGSVPAATAGEISILADADLNLLSEQVINIGASGTGQPSAISFNTSGPTSPGNAITFFVANSGNDIQFPANAYLKLLGAIKDSAGDVAGNANRLLISDSSDKLVWKDESELAVENIVEAVANNTSSFIAKGTPLHIAANPSGVPRVEPADARIPSTMPASGVALTDIPAGINQPGEMLIIGQLESVNTVAYSEGDILYVADGGGLSGKPVNFDRAVQNIGIVTKAAASGAIQVTATGRSNDLPNNNPNSLFSANASGFPASTTGKLEVDVANDTVKIGETAATTDVTITSNQFRAEVVNSTAAGVNNFVIGSSALSQAFANGGGGINNTALGVAAMSGNVGVGSMEASYNVAVGQNTLASGTGLTNTVLFNTAVGYRAMAGTGSGPTTYNTAIGANSLENINSLPAQTFGDLNTAVGSSSLFNLTNGEENVAVGSSAGTGLTTGKYNTFVGTNANSTNANMQLATSIGYNADVTADGGTALGANSVVTGVGGVALGARAIAAANRLNIKVDNVAGPNPQGGLPTFADRAAALAGGLTPGDVYCAAPGGPDNPGSSFLLAII